ncbi:FAD-binding oxidoreductase [Sphingorhabdus sp.]|uniref:FAD-binding oxidoreductase n=1 Tax=Sphingorhabdus sp. TaxID=1902408 RepID=UPI0038FCB1B8
MVQVNLTTGLHFDCLDGVSVLESAAKAQIALPYSCKTGRCSSCKCKVLSGQSRLLVDELGLTTEETEDGWILSCARTAVSDLLIEVEDISGFVIPTVKTLPARISSLKKLAPDVLRVILRVPPNNILNYLPGQYVNVIGAGGVRRSYSIANAPSADGQLELHIRAVAGGVMSDYWFSEAKTDDLVRINGPLGSFFLRETAGLDLVFLATGTGIAPIKAIIEAMPQLAASKPPRSVTVVWGGRVQDDMYLDVAAMPGNHVFITVLSRASPSWSGGRGYVQQALLEVLPDLSKAAVYACGSDAMIHSARLAMFEAGLPANRFYSDAFVSSAAN